MTYRAKKEITATVAHVSPTSPPEHWTHCTTPCFVKRAMWIERGCHLACFPKKTGAKPVCASARDWKGTLSCKMLTPTDQKLHARIQRSTDMTSHSVPLVQFNCWQKRISVAFVFMDLVSAFSSIPRTRNLQARVGPLAAPFLCRSQQARGTILSKVVSHHVSCPCCQQPQFVST